MTRPPDLPADSLAYSFRQAAAVVTKVRAGQSLAEGFLASVPAAARPAVQDHVYQCLRQYGRGDFLLDRLLQKSPPDEEIRSLLLVVLSRLEDRVEQAHTIVDQAVEAAGKCAGGRYRGLVNGVLRNFLRRHNELLAAAEGDDVARCCLPMWWLEALRAYYPGQWRDLVDAASTSPPMAVRINVQAVSREDWQASLQSAGLAGRPFGGAGVLLEKPVPVDRLPGFHEGLVSVQDLGAQRAAELLAPSPGAYVLDACAAPGGKTSHLLEMADLDLLALDLKAARCRRVEENLARLRLTAKVQVADCLHPEKWWDGRPFDAVLADVPCSASGVVRRHPDVKWLRRPADVETFAATQSRMLDVLWRVLRPGGKLLYATCSVFPQENEEQIRAFVARMPGCRIEHQEKLLPDPEHDGFYYCLVERLA